MQVDQGAYGGVRYALQPEESRSVKQIAQGHGGLTRDEIRALARRFGVTTKPIHHALEELKLPVLPKREAQPFGDLLKTLHKDAPKPAKAKVADAAPDRNEIENLRRENARLQKEVDEARRMRAQADTDLAKAKKAIADTAELRRQTASEREALEEERQVSGELEETLRKCRLVLDALAANYAEIVTRMSKDDLAGLIEAAQEEMQRRENGGRRQKFPYA